MICSINTDYAFCEINPRPRLEEAAKIGFTHIMWCHQWNTDYFYTKYEIEKIAQCFKEYNLQLLDIHGSAGMGQHWLSAEEYQRKAGVELIINRIEMLSKLGGIGFLTMHGPGLKNNMSNLERTNYAPKLDAVRRSLDELIPTLEKYNVKIALENLIGDTFEYLDILLKEYPEKYVGITYDCGHGNLSDTCGRGLDWLDMHKDRLLALHLHDNDGSKDLHQPPFYGTIDWNKLLRIIKSSPYGETDKPLSFELSMFNTSYRDTNKEYNAQDPENIKNFLQESFEKCSKTVDIYNSL